MIVVTSRSSGTRVELCCCLCFRRLGLTSAWMAFPADADGAESKWVHEACVRGRLRQLFDQSHAVLMRADMALAHLALSLNYTDE
jgi:hypothetical protein